MRRRNEEPCSLWEIGWSYGNNQIQYSRGATRRQARTHNERRDDELKQTAGGATGAEEAKKGVANALFLQVVEKKAALTSPFLPPWAKWISG
jgi:hypothetical protein